MVQSDVCASDAPEPPYATRNPLTDGTATTTTVTAGRRGRLTLPLTLGAANTQQEYLAETNAATHIYRTTVSIAAAPRTAHRSARDRR